MSDHFQKSGMSDLGCMAQWDGTKDGKLGTCAWFCDVINGSSFAQEGKSTMGGMLSLLEELCSNELASLCRSTMDHDQSWDSPSETVLATDNALSNEIHTPFIKHLNQKKDHCPVVHWINNEAQRGKSFLDSHF